MDSSLSQDAHEHIEWDEPLSDYHSNDPELLDFRKLSVHTEIRNKMWENDNKSTLNHFRSSHSPLLDQNQNLSHESNSMFNGISPNFQVKGRQPSSHLLPASFGTSLNVNRNQSVAISQHVSGLRSQNGIAPRARSQPLLQSPDLSGHQEQPAIRRSDSSIETCKVHPLFVQKPLTDHDNDFLSKIR